MIEHTDVEIDEGEAAPPPESPQSPEGHRHSPHQIIVAALAQRLPCRNCGSIDPCRCVPVPESARTEERASIIEQALALYGYLPSAEAERTFDPEETARWLADRSGFVRYTQVTDGWRRLIEAEPDVELAAIKALQRVPTDEVEMVKAAKAALLAWHQSKDV